jgi:hypothetical protein
MEWLESITRLCELVNCDSTIEDILLTAVRKSLITLEEGKKIAFNNDCEFIRFSQLRGTP